MQRDAALLATCAYTIIAFDGKKAYGQHWLVVCMQGWHQQHGVICRVVGLLQLEGLEDGEGRVGGAGLAAAQVAALMASLRSRGLLHTCLRFC